MVGTQHEAATRQRYATQAVIHHMYHRSAVLHTAQYRAAHVRVRNARVAKPAVVRLRNEDVTACGCGGTCDKTGEHHFVTDKRLNRGFADIEAFWRWTST